MKPDGNDGLSATPRAAPSPSAPTRTSEPMPATAPGPAAAPDPAETSSPQVRDPARYQILGEHGRGGLGRVSRVHDRELGRDIAIKELISRGHISEVRFLREALITARLEHPGIVPVYEAGRWADGTPFYAMKLVAGRSLRDLIAERTTVDERIALLHHVIAVADAIAYAHGRNIIHRDLKPANVIVGDFGETVVIDWGLAKDLTTTEDSAIGGGPFRANRDDGLTSAGSVLGTPAYMAPEQERGESVDQRADVFAIGAMLWELCTLQKLPPSFAGQRHRILRRAGIDQDLVTIINKALAPDPAHRYPNAGALAADLKAFKAGARIAARRYSLFAMLAHWTRRHRTLALSIGAVVAVALAGSILYVRNITAERRRAVRSEQTVERAQTSAEASLDALTLKHAELLLATDPSAVIDSLATYHGANSVRASQLRAEATGRGTALLRSSPHTDAIYWIHGNSDGSIISFSIDGTISKTLPNGSSDILAMDVTRRGAFSYSPSRHLLAYACDPSDLCIFDIIHNKHFTIAHELDGTQFAGIDFSPDGTHIASISQTGELRIFEVATPEHSAERFHINTGNGVAILFVAPDAVAVGTDGGLKLIHLNGKMQILLDPDGSFWDADTKHHRLALATTRGQGLLAKTDDLRVVARVTLCRDNITGLRFIPYQDVVAFICREGTVGTWDLRRGTVSPRARVEGHAQTIEVSGDYLVVASDNGVLTAIDLYTNLTTSFKGHGFRLIAISLPTTEYPFLLSGDVHGRIRAWPLPSRLARMVANTQGRVRSATFNKAANATIATSLSSKIAVFSPSTGIKFVGPHEENAVFIGLTADTSNFVTYGASQFIEIWSSLTMTRRYIFDTHHGSVTHSAFIAHTNDLITSGRDGRLVRWTPAGSSKLIAEFNQPITNFVLASESKRTVIATADGALWLLAEDNRIIPLRNRGIQITRLLMFPDAFTVCVGYSNGEVITIDTNSLQQTLLLHATEGIRDIALTRDDGMIAIATNADTIHIGVRHGSSFATTAVTWMALTARARSIALTEDGILLAACADGTIWIYSSTHDIWMYIPTGTIDLTQVVLTSDNKAGIIFDDEGHVIWIDLELIRNAIENQKSMNLIGHHQ